VEIYRLYHYWRSTASWRVRWALAMKGIQAELVPVGLLDGEAESATHRRRNPMAYVPVLERLNASAESDDRFMIESIAILEYLEETHPQPALLPADPLARAHVRALCQIINAGTQPLGNLSVLQHLSEDPAVQKKWTQHWMRKGLEAFETFAKKRAGRFSFGDTVTMADLCLIPQAHAGARFEVDVEHEFPFLHRICQASLALEECRKSSPEAHKPPEA
jgi:maleylpyruvate isomerase